MTAAEDRAELRDRLLRVLGGVPATPAPSQSQMLAAAAAKDGLSPHVDLVAARITGPVDIAALRTALDALVARHEMLRTHFVFSPSTLMVVRPPERAQLTVEPISDLTEAGARAAALMATPADVGASAPHRALLLSLDEYTHVLLAPLPHLVSDEVSHGIYLRDLAALYAGAELPPPGRYRDHAAAQAAALADGAAVA
ncbi:MAG: condensation domain-containing protein, partial [Actinophytocola sp.]|uniref:condensation domain-containing protein n=1 Tax=Actinophytocola sp. TaxID=1872138 RepID=UPI003C755FDA